MSLKVILLKLIGRISPLLLTKILYRKTFGKSLNLKQPKTLNEKIHWLKFYGDTSLWALMSDKYRVREYVKGKGLEHILVELYGVWEDANNIEWDKLPEQFVLKANNGCGDITLCTDKSKIDKHYLITYYNGLMKKQFGIQTGQLHYKQIKPCIIAEALLDPTKQQTSSSSLIDYKIWCLDGVPCYVFVVLNRKKGYAQQMLYDIDWVAHPEYLVTTSHLELYNDLIPKPSNLNKMLKYASILSEGSKQMRVDMYEVDGRVYFGELTLTSACGYMNYFTEDFLEQLGSKIVLPIDKR